MASEQTQDIPSTETPAQEETQAEAPAITWDLIKTYFLPVDIKCMSKRFDLSDKDDVADNAAKIYLRTKNKQMPKQMPPWTQENPDPAHPLWTDQMCANFKAWMDAGFP
ncbi:hypothetical protein QBC38DRAFT_454935 [Podospora fimiseda]|uniref:Uncharacterized protein n=1 Tax=Podospora fimiseda TaxID=252190 RepID=A0AAN7GZL5_9PEZI|nr:hypothetical protein QBC38DRAFT_454935 [Podospora fimiseda]